MGLRSLDFRFSVDRVTDDGDAGQRQAKDLRPKTQDLSCRILIVMRFSTIILLLCVLWIPTQAQNAAWQRDLSAWRAEHAVEMQKPDGWLALVDLEWLQKGDDSVGSAPDNRIHLSASAPTHLAFLNLAGETVTVNPPPGGFPDGFLIDGKPAVSQTLFTGTDSDDKNPRLTVGSLSMYVIRRGDRFALRIKDSKSAALNAFHGLKWFRPDAKYRVNAQWVPYEPARSTRFTTLIGTNYTQPVPGAAEFVLGGKRYRLEPVVEEPNAEHAEPKLFFVIRDRTSKTTTYGACRFLYTSFPDHGLKQSGRLMLDFNRLENPPCAYTPYATCPLPPRGNRLQIPLTVGERRYHD